MGKDNQHYIPQGYLRGFTIPSEKSLIWEYDKNSGAITRNPKSIRNICSEYQYYSQKNEDGSTDKESVENSFHEIENIAPEIIKKIKLSASGEKMVIDSSEIGALSFFVALLLSRGPNFRNGIEELHRQVVEKSLAILVDQDKRKGILPESIERLYNEGQINIDIEPFVSLQPMIDLARQGAEVLLSKTWHFLAPAKGMNFVTSDCPVYFQLPEKFRNKGGTDIGPFHQLTELTIPLRKDLLLLISPSVEYTAEQIAAINLTSVFLDKQGTKNMNKRTALAAGQYVYASEKSDALARMIGKLKGTKQHLKV